MDENTTNIQSDKGEKKKVVVGGGEKKKKRKINTTGRVPPKYDPTKPRSKPISSSVRAGLLFPVGRLNTKLHKHQKGFKIRKNAVVFLTATLEYIITELIESSGNCAREMKKVRITPKIINEALEEDEELKLLQTTLGGSNKVNFGSIPSSSGLKDRKKRIETTNELREIKKHFKEERHQLHKNLLNVKKLETYSNEDKKKEQDNHPPKKRKFITTSIANDDDIKNSNPYISKKKQVAPKQKTKNVAVAKKKK